MATNRSGTDRTIEVYDLNEDCRDILTDWRSRHGLGIEKAAKNLGLSGKARLERIESYPEKGGWSLATLSKVLTNMGLDPVTFFSMHHRYAARVGDPLARELRRTLSEVQIKELTLLCEKLHRRGRLSDAFRILRELAKGPEGSS